MTTVVRNASFAPGPATPRAEAPRQISRSARARQLDCCNESIFPDTFKVIRRRRSVRSRISQGAEPRDAVDRAVAGQDGDRHRGDRDVVAVHCLSARAIELRTYIQWPVRSCIVFCDHDAAAAL